MQNPGQCKFVQFRLNPPLRPQLQQLLHLVLLFRSVRGCGHAIVGCLSEDSAGPTPAAAFKLAGPSTASHITFVMMQKRMGQVTVRSPAELIRMYSSRH